MCRSLLAALGVVFLAPNAYAASVVPSVVPPAVTFSAYHFPKPVPPPIKLPPIIIKKTYSSSSSTGPNFSFSSASISISVSSFGSN